tara:strand:+ start:8107 stop:8499 length:393 start_codon:yes stop_codon:yes gene_type:complete
MYHFTFYGRPKPKNNTRYTKGAVYTEPKVKKYQSEGRWIIRSHFRDEIINKPVSLIVKAFFPIPKSTPKYKVGELLNRPYPHKPDGDNLLKMICDILKGIVITDDCLITSKSIEKLYGDKARTEIYLEVL